MREGKKRERKQGKEVKVGKGIRGRERKGSERIQGESMQVINKGNDCFQIGASYIPS